MLELRQGQKFTIVRQLTDPYDTGTYYVRCIVRNSVNGATLLTANLTDGGNQRFTYDWTVPNTADDTQIDIETSVYTDSGYTTYSANYWKECTNYMIRDTMRALGGGVGGGWSLSATQVREIVASEVKRIKIPEQREPDLNKVYSYIRDINDAISRLPRFEKTDLTELKREISLLDSTLSKKIDHIPQTDLMPLVEAIDSQKETINKAIYNFEKQKEFYEEIQAWFEKLKEFFVDFFTKDIEEIKQNVSQFKKIFKKEMSKVAVITTKPFENSQEDDEQEEDD